MYGLADIVVHRNGPAALKCAKHYNKYFVFYRILCAANVSIYFDVIGCKSAGGQTELFIGTAALFNK
jgi:hypothetical protein